MAEDAPEQFHVIKIEFQEVENAVRAFDAIGELLNSMGLHGWKLNGFLSMNSETK